MKKFLLMFLMFMSININCSAASIEKDASVAVMDFGTHPGAVPIDINIFNAGQAAAEYVIDSLVTSGKFNVIDRTMVEDKIKAENLNTTGIIDPDTARRIGQILGAKYIIYGNVNDVTISEVSGSIAGSGASVCTIGSNLILRLMRVETGDIITVAKGSGKSRSGKGNALIIEIGNVKVSQEGVHNALKKAAAETVKAMLTKLYGPQK